MQINFLDQHGKKWSPQSWNGLTIVEIWESPWMNQHTRIPMNNPPPWSCSWYKTPREDNISHGVNKAMPRICVKIQKMVVTQHYRHKMPNAPHIYTQCNPVSCIEHTVNHVMYTLAGVSCCTSMTRIKNWPLYTDWILSAENQTPTPFTCPAYSA